AAIFAPVLGNKEVIMPAYFIVDVNVQDPAGFEEYRKRVPATIEKYGGKFLVRGGKFEKLEGNWEPTRVVLLEFPSLEQAKRWYDSAEHRDAQRLPRPSSFRVWSRPSAGMTRKSIGSPKPCGSRPLGRISFWSKEHPSHASRLSSRGATAG